MKKKDNSNYVQKNLIVEFFKKNSNRDIKHPEVVDWDDYLQEKNGQSFP